jgi:hypothetical protein
MTNAKEIDIPTSLRDLRTAPQYQHQVNMVGVRFGVRTREGKGASLFLHLWDEEYEDDEDPCFCNNGAMPGDDALEKLERAYSIRQGLFVQAPGSKKELLDEAVTQFNLEVEKQCRDISSPMTLLYYIKAIDHLDGACSTEAIDAVVKALGQLDDCINFDEGASKSARRFVEQFASIAKKMIEAHDLSVFNADGSTSMEGIGAKRCREEFDTGDYLD